MDNTGHGPGHYIYVAYVTCKNGERIYARDYGLKCFRIKVSDKKR